MSIVLNRVLSSFKGSTPSNGVEKALLHIAGGIDNLNNLIKDSHDIQMAGSRADDLGDKKARALMIVIEKMTVRAKTIKIYPHQLQFSFACEEIFKFFEKAKIISKAENETEFQAAIADL